MAQIKITQKRSIIGATKRQKATMRALGLKKIGQAVVHAFGPEIAGMAKAVNHLVIIEEI
ncbi:MAG: 50S ribosomal protein L30 [Cytophagales bacterium]